MKRLTYIVLVAALSQSCMEKKPQPKREIHNDMFNWTITIPENFDTINGEQWAKLQHRGAEAIEKTYNTKIENNAKTIFAFNTDRMNYFEANYQPFDTAVDGDYMESFRMMNEVLYNTFTKQMEGAQVDTSSSTETISGLLFQVSNTDIRSDKISMHLKMYSHLFDKKDFTVNIMYTDEKKGKLMTDALKHSTFGK